MMKLIYIFLLFFISTYSSAPNTKACDCEFAAPICRPPLLTSLAIDQRLNLHATESNKIAFNYIKYMVDPSLATNLKASVPLVRLPHVEGIPASCDEKYRICIHYECLVQEKFKELKIPGINPLNLKLEEIPAGSGGSGATIYLVKDSENKITVAAFKAYQTAGKKDLDEILHVETAQQLVSERTQDFARILTSGEILGGPFFSLQAIAPGQDLDKEISKHWDEEKKEIKNIDLLTKILANTLATLHKTKDPDDLESASKIRHANLFDNWQSIAKRKLIDPKNYSPPLMKKLEQVTFLLEAKLQEKPDSFLFKGIHGDTNGANIFFHSEKRKVTFIDFATAFMSFDPKTKQFIGDPASDIGRLSAYLETETIQHGSSVEYAMKIGQQLIDEYRTATQMTPEQSNLFDLSLYLYRSRYYSLLVSEGGAYRLRRGNPKLEEENTLRNNIYQLWIKSTENLESNIAQCTSTTTQPTVSEFMKKNLFR